MQAARWTAAAAGLALVATVSAGCLFHYEDDCFRARDCPNGTGGGVPDGCDPSANKAPVDDTCGVFVSPSGDDGNAGTKAKPLKTLGAALSRGTIIYACAGAVPYAEAVTIDDAVTLFGAVDCAKGWAYDASKKTQLTAAPDAIPVKLTSTAGGSAIHDFAITAVDAMTPGGSSIALLDDGADINVVRCDIAAGKGADGAAGATPMGSGQKGADAPVPMPATALDGCVMGQNAVLGGQPGQSMCGTVDTSGSLGGNGTNLTIGGTATDAQPQPQPNAMPSFDGKAGKPQDGTSCLPGDHGADGLPGATPGTGATGLGDITPTGYQAPAATPGQSAGSPGYGGGGGGGAKKCANGFAGPAGGGGGAGGCGGQPGGAGQSAGSSFALVSLNATISLDTVTLTSADGGAGGVGGDGQPGGQGGKGGIAGDSGGDGSVSACDGGKGGQGGRGSSGGGGLGGHSAGIAFTGKAPARRNVTVNHGKGGAGGIGGDMDKTSPGIVGGDGLECSTLDFAEPASPKGCVM